MEKCGYHKTIITKGILGEISKIQEELDELKDAYDQNNKVLELCELADIIGAINLYLIKHFPDITIHNLITMAEATERAFENGER